MTVSRDWLDGLIDGLYDEDDWPEIGGARALRDAILAAPPQLRGSTDYEIEVDFNWTAERLLKAFVDGETAQFGDYVTLRDEDGTVREGVIAAIRPGHNYQSYVAYIRVLPLAAPPVPLSDRDDIVHARELLTAICGEAWYLNPDAVPNAREARHVLSLLLFRAAAPEPPSAPAPCPTGHKYQDVDTPGAWRTWRGEIDICPDCGASLGTPEGQKESE
jgi:hypothetical protein